MVVIAFHGFWPGWDYTTSPLFGLLSQDPDFKFTNDITKGDVIVTSVFGQVPNTNKFIVAYMGEPRSLFNEPNVDLILSFEPDDDRHFYLPHWLHDAITVLPNKTLSVNLNPRPLKSKTEYCAIFASHDRFNTRAGLFTVLNQYRPVHSFGAWRNNQPSDNARGDEVNRSNLKMNVLDKYKFSLAVENTSQPYYITEKLTESLLCNTIPIYWGDPLFEQSEFNLDRVLYANKMSNTDLLSSVMMLDKCDTPFEEKIKQPFFEGGITYNNKKMEQRGRELCERIRVGADV